MEGTMGATAQAQLSTDDGDRTWRQDRDHFVHPWTHFDSFKTEGSLVIAEGKGAYVYDSAGKPYLDGIGGLWCVNIGYGNEEMVQAIADQARRLAFFSAFVDTTNPPAAELAAKLAALAPGRLNHVCYTCTGSDANDTAVRLVHFYHARRGKPTKKHVIARVDGYHGSTYLGMSLTGKPGDRSPYFHYISDIVHHVSSPNVYRRPAGMTEVEFCDRLVAELEQTIEAIGSDNVAAFIAEPVLGAGGVIVPPPGYHRRTAEVCRRHDVLYISDEVVTGFGRLGHFFASKAVFDVEPDIIVTAKGISSGYVPLGATIFSDAIHEVISAPDADVWFTHGFTYSGHPVACAAGLKNIEIIERDRICEHVRQLGPYFEQELAKLKALPLVGDVRGSHFMLCVENVADRETRETLPDEVNVGKRISNHCEARGLIVRPIGHLNVMSPPLILTKAQIDELVAILRESILVTVDELTREGHRLV
jgi:adenosylmethionine-8-amino-7-oxononanoate aminotransferase